MYTQCPACKTVFRLHPDQLNAAQGRVRCSRCQTVFKALDNLFAAQEQPSTIIDEANSVTDKSGIARAVERPIPERGEPSLHKRKAAYNKGVDNITSRPDGMQGLTKQAHAPEPLRAGTDKKTSLTRAANAAPQADAKQHLTPVKAPARPPIDVDLETPHPSDASSPMSSEKNHRLSQAKEQAAAQERNKAVGDSASSLFSGSPRTVGTPPDAPVKPVESPGATPLDKARTIPRIGPDDTRADTTIKAPVRAKPSIRQHNVSAAEEITEPPLFEFDAAFGDLPIATDAGNVPTGNTVARKKKRRPAAEQHKELDLFGWNETEASIQDDSMLFHYLPEENLADGLIAGEPLTEDTDAPPVSTTQEKDDTQKATQTRPGYTLPLEHDATRSSLRGPLLWGSGILLMLAALTMQYIYYHRIPFAQEPSLRPLLARMCLITGCQLPAQRDLSRIELGKHLVQVHPRYVGSLLITANLVNRADFAQPFPIVEVVMTDLEQKQVARRRFMPGEYLIGGNGQRDLPPSTEVPLMLEVLDPGNNAVGFEFNFY